jgi:hypothetical protein
MKGRRGFAERAWSRVPPSLTRGLTYRMKTTRQEKRRVRQVNTIVRETALR